ncbi:hypothetical protein [Streptomyces sp. NPDC091212]|uniref:hypothetical protein n=1 Tax=Streptomyces sp. NPDC091212 TaxID=3155191 RepID=UPI003430B0FC
MKAYGNWSGSVSGRSVFDNGNVRAGAGRIRLTWTYNGGTWTDRFHYRTVTGVVLKKAVSRGDC